MIFINRAFNHEQRQEGKIIFSARLLPHGKQSFEHSDSHQVPPLNQRDSIKFDKSLHILCKHMINLLLFMVFVKYT